MARTSDHLVRRGVDNIIAPSGSGSDCFLVHDTRVDQSSENVITAMSAGELYLKRNELGIELNKIYESVTGCTWSAEINTNGSGVDVFKVNSYRIDIDGPIGLKYVETKYGNNQFQVYLPYSYTEDKVMVKYPAFILNRRNKIIITYPDAITSTIKKYNAYFEKLFISNEGNNDNIHRIDIMDLCFTIVDERCKYDRPKQWGDFEYPTDELKLVIRLLIKVGWLDTKYLTEKYEHIFSMKDLGLEKESSNPYGFEVIDGDIMRFTKYSDDLWVQIRLDNDDLKFIKPKEKVIYYDTFDKLTADVITKINSPEKGIVFICFNLENNYVFTTVEYDIFDVILGKTPQYEVESVLTTIGPGLFDFSTGTKPNTEDSVEGAENGDIKDDTE